VGAKWEAKKCPGRVSFLSAIRDNFSATWHRPIFAKFGHDTWIVGETQNSDINLWKVSIQGSFAPKTQNFEGVKQVLNSEQATGKGYTAERCCLFHVVVQRPRSLRYRSTFLYDVRLRSYGASKLPNFRILAYFSHTKPVKRTFRWPTYSSGVTLQNDSDFSLW